MLLEAAELAPPERARVRRGRAARAARENLAEAHALVAAQPPTELAGSSLPDELHRLVGRHGAETSVATSWDLTGEPRRLHAGTEVVVLRCAQEALTNVQRQANAERASLCRCLQLSPLNVVPSLRKPTDPKISPSPSACTT